MKTLDRLGRVVCAWWLIAGVSLLPGCSDAGGPGGDGGGDVPDGVTDSGDTGHDGGSDGADGTGGEADGSADPCRNVSCPAWQHCVVEGVQGRCIDNTCADLTCAGTEECQPHPGGGAWCVDISCFDDLDCPPERFCQANLCRDDVCEGGCQRCNGNAVERCRFNGGGWLPDVTCESEAHFDSLCRELAPCDAHCTCQDDWDCPAWMQCEAGLCLGSGREPSCRLAPEPFTNVLPVPEIVWGGTQANPTAPDSPFSEAVQVVMMPLVANLDDDNGDGLIDERDYPEIVFFAFRQHDYSANGVLRAIHGGGANKGKDFFAVCGDKVWHEGDPLNLACTYTEADIDSTSTPAVGDLDGDGKPEIVALSELLNSNRSIHIYGSTGEIHSKNAATGNLGGPNPAVLIANLDGQGLAEIVVGRNVFTLEKDGQERLKVVDRFQGSLTNGTNSQGPISCAADVAGDERAEIIAGTAAYNLPRPPPGVTRRSQCTGQETEPEHVAFCNGQLLTVWSAATSREGFCAVADVLGVDPALPPGPANPLDGKPEVILIANGRLVILDGATGTLLRDIDLADGTRGGAPNVDDFDGDGFPEVGTAFLDRYIMYDFQPASGSCPAWPGLLREGQPRPAENLPRDPGGSCVADGDCKAGEAVCNQKTGKCVCLHNAWASATEDDSSRVTGSSVFDFNGDGAAEVVYNDECRFRVYDGTDGTIWFSEPSESRTRVEYPVIADVDNDGNAEIVFCTTTESGFCSENLDDRYNAGIEVWGDAGDFWVSARRVWNQHAYHVTNVLESGGIPLIEPASWRSYHGRSYNTYRSNPRSYDWAPDLAIGGMQFSSPDATCGALSQLLDIVLRVENRGDVRVGPGLLIGFEGTWRDLSVVEDLKDGAGQPLHLALPTPLEAGAWQILKVAYNSANNGQGRLPDEVRAIIDVDNRERECIEDNNDYSAPVEAGDQAPDLRLLLSDLDLAGCPTATIRMQLTNEGSLPVAGVVVRFYAGDPNQGGTLVGEHTVTDSLDPGETESQLVALPGFPMYQVTVWGWVDPDNLIAECDEADNQARGPSGNCPPW
ncbi:MAG: hypothetical protein GYA21_02255 [Myxococcales bacterium]|nr:hypothetical protein [Myxococcales bacterium]